MKKLFARKYALIAGSAIAVLAVGSTAMATNGFSSWNTIKNITGGSDVAGTLNLSVGSSNGLTQSVSGLQPGDYTEMPVTITNSGTVSLGSITLGLTATPSTSALVSGTGSLDIFVQSCTVPWTGTTATNTTTGIKATTYACSGTASTALGVAPSSTSTQTTVGSLTSTTPALAGANLGTTSPNNTNNYLVTLSMPSNAPAADEGQSVSLAYTFTGTQQPSGAIGG